MPRSEIWTTISIKKTQSNAIEKIHKETRLNKNDIVEFALIEKYPQYFDNE